LPISDLHAKYMSIKDEIDEAIAAVIRDSSFIRGPWVDRFESEFAALAQAPHCVSCANGTDALFIAMRALGVRPGDEVITSAHSWIATSETITLAGGTVVFADTDPKTHTIDPAHAASLITPRTVGIIPVHLYGQMADMDALGSLATAHGLWMIEDCAQAHLAAFAGRPVGSFGNIATYSFYPGKNLGAMGDAGAITTNDPALARTMAMFARHGGLKKHDHEIEGINSRLDGLQAAILCAKLPHLPHWTERRRELARRYHHLLSRIPDLVLPTEVAQRHHVWHLYVVQHPQRDALATHLASLGIQTTINYPISLPFLPAYRRLGHAPAHFPVAHAQQSRILSLPLFPEMTQAQQELVSDAIRSFPG
jgi:dTDP-4-amino-4,6-dideoxygalactose transaminase